MNSSSYKQATRSPSRSRGRPPNPEQRSAKRSKMLLAALDLFVEHGYEQVTIEQIARAAGQSKGAFYWHFKDKVDCLQEILTAQALEMASGLAQMATPTSTASEQLLALSNYRNWNGKDFRQFIQLLNRLSHSRSESVRDMARRINQEITRTGYETVLRVVKAALREAGWPAERIEAFDFHSWIYIYFSCFAGSYILQQRGDFPDVPTTAAVADVIHQVFILPLIRKKRG